MHLKPSPAMPLNAKKHEHRLSETRQEREAEQKRLDYLKQTLQEKLSARSMQHLQAA